MRQVLKLLDSWAVLIVLAVVFGSITYVRHLAPIAPLEPGEDLSGVVLEDGAGATTSVATGEPLVLLAVATSCGACVRAAPIWREWLDTTSLSAVLVAGEPVEDVDAFAAEFDLELPVRRLRWNRSNRSAAIFAAKGEGTPNVVLLDGSGRVITHGHGSLVAELVSSLTEPGRTP